LRLKPGDERLHKISVDPSQHGLSMLLAFKHPATSLYLVGSLEYRDRLNRRYKTSFCRRYVLGDKILNIQKTPNRFVRVNDPEYEYAD
jgi:hypothetical protein